MTETVFMDGGVAITQLLCIVITFVQQYIMAALFQPLSIRSIQLKNRIVVSPMCQYSSEDGFASDWHLVHLGSRAVGGAALVISEATAISAEGRITPHDLGIWKDDHIPMLKRITGFITRQDAVAGIQLAHAGRKASTDVPWKGSASLRTEEGAWETFAPSAIAYKEGMHVPKEMNAADIEKVINDFGSAAIRARAAGFKVIEVHAAHGYLLHEFLSPLSNHRRDNYGGSFENRIRIVTEVIEAIRTAWPEDLPLFLRISCTDYTEGGWTIEDSIRLASILKSSGVDLIDCSSGGNVHNAKIKAGPLYQAPFAGRIKKEAGIYTGAVGLITTPAEAESLIENNTADIILLARQLLRDPYFPLHAAKDLGHDIEWPVQYERAKQ
jgi:2,4-dienoyl-CoA reductase-like NADH-dependent reductase (Old Yellow Enzyme family)